MPTITPTLTAQRWGRDAGNHFDYYANTTRVAGGNPVIIYRHGGAGFSGSYQSVWDSAGGEIWYTRNYILTTASLAQKFDFVTVSTSERSMASPQIRCQQTGVLDAVREFQLCVAEIKRLGKIGFGPTNQYKTNPNQVVLDGDSFGATVAMLSQLFPPYIGSGGQTTHLYRPYGSAQFSSQARAVINHIGQIDVRTIGGVNQLDHTNCAAWFRTSGTPFVVGDGGTEFAAFPNDIKAAASVRAYIQSGNTEYYRPIFNLYNSGFGSVGSTHPYTDPHDFHQLNEINGDLNTAGLVHGKYLYNPGDLSQGGGTGPRALAAHNAVYNFIAARITSNDILSSLPVP